MMKKRWVIIVTLLILILVMVLAAAWYLICKSHEGEQEYESQKRIYDSVKPSKGKSEVENVNYLADCQEINSDTVAWIMIPDTEIDFPVVQGKDNAYYLNHSFEGLYSDLGVPFLDYRCTSDFTDFNSIIYGHHIKGGMMFSGLDYYKQEDYFKAHSIGYLTTKDKMYIIHFFACLVSESDGIAYNVVFMTDREKTDYLEKISAEALVWNDFSVEFLANKRLVALSTCSYEFEDARTVVIGYLEEEGVGHAQTIKYRSFDR